MIIIAKTTWQTLTISVFLMLTAAIKTFAAGPAKVATYDRNLWPQEINDTQAFNRASLYENLMFASVVKTLPNTPTEQFLVNYIGRKVVNADSVSTWLIRTQKRLLDNINLAKCLSSTTKIACDANTKIYRTWSALSNNIEYELGVLAQAYYPWKEASFSFYQTYTYEQVRLAALFPKITSEVAQLIPAEHTGFEWQDGEFLLSFDDGPSAAGRHTDGLLAWLNANDTTAIFFVLGERLNERRKAQSQAQLVELYRGQCLASHGYIHKSHANAKRWPDSLEKTRDLIQTIQPRTEVFFRPPYGQRTKELSEYLLQRDERVVLWNIDSQDWNLGLTAKQVADRVETLMLLWRRGTVLYHDTHPKALAGMKRLQSLLKANGQQWLDCEKALLRLSLSL